MGTNNKQTRWRGEGAFAPGEQAENGEQVERGFAEIMTMGERCRAESMTMDEPLPHMRLATIRADMRLVWQIAGAGTSDSEDEGFQRVVIRMMQ